jgi:hypothetical protein
VNVIVINLSRPVLGRKNHYPRCLTPA